MDIPKENYNKPKYIEFTGDKEMNNILLAVFNNNFDNIPDEIKNKLDKLHSNNTEKDNGNLRGSIVKIIMITQSGSEGISLKNVRQVHITEPYWNKIRIDQVIGRAVRTKSHMELPKDERNINVYQYLCKFSKEQLKDPKVEMLDNSLTTDQVIFNLADRKAKTNDDDEDFNVRGDTSLISQCWRRNQSLLKYVFSASFCCLLALVKTIITLFQNCNRKKLKTVYTIL